jgi:LuxR family maltose regulon positive regulatory protein
VNPDDAGDVSPLLRIKLAPPVPAAGMLARPELVSRLADPGWKVCLISAPAGWGKTSLVAAWHGTESESRPFAFLRLEEGDDDSSVFWTYAIAALRTVHPMLMDGADAALRTPGMNPMRQIVPLLINELAEIEVPSVLVLDDYHVIGGEDVHTSVAHLIAHLPQTLRLVIATRADPPLPMSRLRAAGVLLEIRAGQLGFTSAETAEFLDRRFGVELESDNAESLRQRTEGWPAGLQLAGLSLVGEPDPQGFVARFAGDDRNVADYLMAEVFRGISGAQQDFLLRTSVLDRMTGRLCDEVAEVSNSVAMLEGLERANLFLIPLDSQRRWYRYHHLFRDWLRYELEKVNADALPQLHAKASRWHEKNGSFESAINHAIASGDGERAAELIDQYMMEWGQVHWSRLAQWLAQLSDKTIAGHALSAIGNVRFALGRGDFPGGWRWIEAAEAAVDRAPDSLRPMAEGTAAQYRAFMELVAGDMDVARVQSLEIADRERSAGSGLFAVAVGVGGMATFWSVGALESIPLLREASIAGADRSISDSGVTALLAAAYAEIGDWGGAEKAAAAAFASPPTPEWHRYPDAMAAHLAAGKALIARGSRDEGIEQIRHGLDMARGWVEPIFVAYGCLALADAVGDFSERRALVREARQLLEGRGAGGRMLDLVAAAERKLALRSPNRQTDGAVHVEPLTDRERDVLRLLKSDLSLPEIANELYIAHNTVKGYTKSVYRKLGVTSRGAAIEAANALDL